MTANWFHLTPRLGGLGKKWGLSARQPAMYVALAAFFVVVLSASSAPRSLSVASAASPPAKAAMVKPADSDLAAAQRHVALPRSATIDAVAALVARKYRVSEQATRGLVAAAYREGLQTGVDPLLLVAVIAVESRFNPIAQSEGGAVGLMQVIPQYHADKLGATELAAVLEPHLNIRVGAKILKDYIGRGGSEVAGLQLYNGASADPTNAYANRVLGEKQWLQNAIARDKERARA